MGLTFEIQDKDIMGRCGKLRVNGRTLHTPALLPVVNPNKLTIPVSDLAAMHVEGIITNAYILIRSSFRDRAIGEGVHNLLSYDGIIMTDSGSYQLSLYGDIALSNEETILFQQRIGSDILVPLDIPTSPAADRPQAEQELGITLDRIREGRDLVGSGQLAAPVQGGLFPDLREQAARAISSLGFTYAPIGAVVPLMEGYRYRDLVSVVMAAKMGLSPSCCVHLFGAGHPAMFALAVAMGCDIFDSAAYALYAEDGRYLTVHGSYRLQELTTLPCPCAVCRAYTPAELVQSDMRTALLARHNLAVTLAEMDRIRHAVREGTLWELVDERCRSHPRLLAGYRAFLEHGEMLEHSDRVSKRRFFYRGAESGRRSEVVRYRAMQKRFHLSDTVLIMMDGKKRGGCSDVLLFRPPFGAYPPELGETFPIGSTELPDWDTNLVREGLRGVRELIAAHPQTRFTLSCSSHWAGLVREMLPGCEVLDDDC
ncbi:MAG: tRNA guanosine(15) transglycosylase TgtA [Methanomicrobiales archaeon]|nr:tRNA guanosine(15) transglycosylase TgtA [Methanomicrobiales archaeon]